jgi:hypothetical protein
VSYSIDPIENEDLYDHILLAGVKSPGVVTLSGHDRKVEWDVKSGPQLNGATTTVKSIPPIEFTATFYLVKDYAQDSNDLDDWPRFLAVVNSSLGERGGKAAPKALDIYHPDLATNGITSVCKASVGGVVHDGKGGQTIAIRFQEYRPPKAIKVTPIGSVLKGPDPDAAALAELDRLVKINEKTPWS